MTGAGRSLWTGVAVAFVLVGVALLAASAFSGGGAAEAAGADEPLDPVTRLSTLHEAGFTGTNVSVGVVDVTGFDTGRRAYRDQVVAARSFGSDESVGNAGRNDHGTAAASTVAAVAPDADLYLASFDAGSGYRRALSWMTSRGVDVVVAPVTFYGKPGDGSSAVDRATARAVRNGTVVVAPLGNMAAGHWRGRYLPARNGSLDFGGGTRNYVAGNPQSLTLWLSWDEAHRDQDYTAELYWTNGTATRLVQRSRPYEGDDVPNERIVADLDRGSHFVVVRGPSDGTTARLRLESPTHRFQYRNPRGSIAAPATSPGVLAVGAYDRRHGAVAPFSSRGPTIDGRVGVDVVAPSRIRASGDRPFVGSSAAASYVAAMVVLRVQNRPDASPRDVERAFERAALDVGPPGVDAATGYGRVVPARAVVGNNGTSSGDGRSASIRVRPALTD